MTAHGTTRKSKYHRLYRALGTAGALALAATLQVIAPAVAQVYPSRPITMIVPFGAGGSSDAIARIVGEHLSRSLGKPLIIENEGGAGGTTATARAARAKPDGYTLIMGNLGTHGAAPAQYPNLKYDPAKDFTPIGLSAGVPLVIITRKNFPADDLKSFVVHLKDNPHKVSEGHAGVGSQTHAMCTMLIALIGAKPIRVAYRSTAQAVNDLIGGQLDFACAALTGVTSQIQGNVVKALAIASPARAPIIPDVPTTTEGGLPQFQVSAWNALFAPKGLPPDIQSVLSRALIETSADAATRKRLLDIGAELPTAEQLTPQALHELVEREVARWSAVLKDSGVK
jgi:tripartite-type tricarboxylate transporter receptor subunit TctC